MLVDAATVRSDDYARIDVDQALALCGFGRFQQRLLAAPILMAHTFAFLALLPVLLLPRLKEPWNLSSADEALVESAFYMGQFASPIFGFLSDRSGRQRSSRILFTASYILGLLHFACSDIYQLIMLRALSGVVSGGMVVVVFLAAMELCPPNRRSLVTTLGFALGWTSNTLLLVAVDWAFSELAWQWLVVAGAVPTPVALLWLPETPQFLLAAGRSAESLEVVRRIGTANGVPLPASAQLREHVQSGPPASQPSLSRGACTEVSRLLPALLFAGLSWLGSVTTYNGSVFWPVRHAHERGRPRPSA